MSGKLGAGEKRQIICPSKISAKGAGEKGRLLQPSIERKGLPVFTGHQRTLVGDVV